MFQYSVTILDAILNNSKRSMMPAGHHSDSDSTLLPLPKSAITWFGGIFARLPPLAAGLIACTALWSWLILLIVVKCGVIITKPASNHCLFHKKEQLE